MVKETEYVAVLAEEQGFDDVLKIHIYLKARRKNSGFYCLCR